MSLTEQLVEELTLDDLDEEQRALAECIGLDAYKRLVAEYSGSYVYVQKPDTVTSGLRNAALKREFNGYNYLELAKKYNLSESSVRRIVSERLNEIRAKPLDNQETFF